MIMVFAGIALLIAAFTSVLLERNKIPSEPNLPAKTILLTQSTFDVVSFYFQTTVADVSQNIHLLSKSGLANCQKVSVEATTASIGSSIPISPLSGDYIITPECVLPTLITDYQSRFSTELDNRFAALSSQTSGDLGETVHPKSFLFNDPSKKFIAGQFMVDLNEKNAAAPAVTVISRQPLAIHASAQTLDNTANQWTFDARRDLMTTTPLTQDDANLLQLIATLPKIKADAWTQIAPLVNNPDPNHVITDDEKTAVLAKISSAITLDQQINFLKPISQNIQQAAETTTSGTATTTTTATATPATANIASTTTSPSSYFAFNVILYQNTIYVVFQNAAMATPVYTFS